MGLRNVSGYDRRKGHERRTRVELRICKELDKMLPIARDNVVALEMQGYVAECVRVTVNIECPHFVGTATTAVKLLAEEVRKV